MLEFDTFTRLKEDLRIKSKTSFKKTGNIETDANDLLLGYKIGVPTSVHVQNRVRNRGQNYVQYHVQSHVQNHVRKIKKIVNKNISFLKITDPKKRDYIVNEFLKTRQNIQQNLLSERVGDLSTQYQLSKLLKPVTDMQKISKEGLVTELNQLEKE